MMLNKFKKELESQREAIIAKSIAIKEQEIDLSGDEIDSIQGKILALADSQLVARNQEKLRRIEIALKRIQDGTFGVCGACDEDIGERRLQINPIYSLCVSCAEGVEISKNRR